MEHRHYRGARNPCRVVFDHYDDLVEYLEGHTFAGDSFHIWKFEACCRDDNVSFEGKVPNAEGQVPIGGSY